MRPARPARVVGYAFTILFMLAVLVAANVWPGWEAVPFLSDEVPSVLGLVNLSLVATVVANGLYVVADPRWLVAAAEVVLSAISVAVAWQVVTVFPFDFNGVAYDLSTLVRIAVVLGLAATVVGFAVNLVRLAREVSRVA